jgi:hypothetical protein
VDTKFRNKKLLSYYAKFSHFSRNFVNEYREQIAQNVAKHCQFGGLDLGHAPNQIVKHKKRATDTMLHAKLGQLLGT